MKFGIILKLRSKWLRSNVSNVVFPGLLYVLARKSPQKFGCPILNSQSIILLVIYDTIVIWSYTVKLHVWTLMYVRKLISALLAMMKLLMKQFYLFKLYHSTSLTLFEKLLAWKVRLVNILSLLVR